MESPALAIPHCTLKIQMFGLHAADSLGNTIGKPVPCKVMLKPFWDAHASFVLRNNFVLEDSFADFTSTPCTHPHEHGETANGTCVFK